MNEELGEVEISEVSTIQQFSYPFHCFQSDLEWKDASYAFEYEIQQQNLARQFQLFGLELFGFE